MKTEQTVMYPITPRSHHKPIRTGSLCNQIRQQMPITLATPSCLAHDHCALSSSPRHLEAHSESAEYSRRFGADISIVCSSTTERNMIQPHGIRFPTMYYSSLNASSYSMIVNGILLLYLPLDQSPLPLMITMSST